MQKISRLRRNPLKRLYFGLKVESHAKFKGPSFSSVNQYFLNFWLDPSLKGVKKICRSSSKIVPAPMTVFNFNRSEHVFLCFYVLPTMNLRTLRAKFLVSSLRDSAKRSVRLDDMMKKASLIFRRPRPRARKTGL